MPEMKKNRIKFLLTFTALALLAGCDDNGGQSSKTSWLEWLKQKDEPKLSLSITGITAPNYVRETQAGNYLAGQFAQYRQDWGMANKYLDKVMALDPKNIDLQQRAMILSMQAGDTTRAVALARKVLEEDDKNLLGLLFVGIDEMQRGEYKQSIHTLKKMPSNGIADFVRPILIAWAEAPEGRFDEDALIANGPLHAYHALLIKDYLGKVDDPEKYFINVLTGGGADKHILEMMGDAYARQGNSTLSNKIYDTLLMQGETAGSSSRQKLLQEKREKPDLAVSSKIQTPAQGAAEAFYNMARILYQDQSDDSALVFIRLSQFLDPSKEDVRMLLASSMIRAGHIEDAVALYKAVKIGSPGYPESQRSAAELLEQEGRIDEAIAFLNQKFEEEKDINYLIQIGDVYRRADRHADAIKAYDRAVDTLGGKVSSDYWNLLYARGMSYERIGNLSKAEKDLEAALEFRPDHPYLLNYLGYSWADQNKKLDKALELISKAVDLKPDDGYIVDSLGWVYYKLGEYENAVAELEKAIELVPYDPTINDHLGDAYWQVGRKQEARFQWARALNHTKEEADKPSLELKISEGLMNKKAPVQEAKSRVPDTTPVKQP